MREQHHYEGSDWLTYLLAYDAFEMVQWTADADEKYKNLQIIISVFLLNKWLRHLRIEVQFFVSFGEKCNGSFEILFSAKLFSYPYIYTIKLPLLTQRLFLLFACWHTSLQLESESQNGERENYWFETRVSSLNSFLVTVKNPPWRCCDLSWIFIQALPWVPRIWLGVYFKNQSKRTFIHLLDHFGAV